MFIFNVINSGANIGEIILCILSFLVAAMLAIVIHEVAHGYVALKCGDPTAKLQNRLTLNPVAHFDIVGLLMMILVGFGWAKPVPINPNNFRNRKKGMILVSLAGVVSNLIMAATGLLILFLVAPIIKYSSTTSTIIYALQILIYFFLVFFIKINFILAFFNLLPIYPLDGFQLLNVFLKPYNKFSEFMRRYGSWVLIGVIVLSRILNSSGLYKLDIFYWANYIINLLLDLVA
ncbi:MAG: site-2 protease family protein [Clostridia bacterium]